MQPQTSKSEDPVSPATRSRRRGKRRVLRKYSVLLGALLLAALGLIVLPLWLVHPPYGKAVMLSLPPMVLCALSWMAGAWWAWDKDRHVLFAVTLGASPARLFLALGWAWLVLSIAEVPFVAFVLGLMWHWIIFTVPELAMMYELSQKTRAYHRDSAKG